MEITFGFHVFSANFNQNLQQSFKNQIISKICWERSPHEPPHRSRKKDCLRRFEMAFEWRNSLIVEVLVYALKHGFNYFSFGRSANHLLKKLSGLASGSAANPGHLPFKFYWKLRIGFIVRHMAMESYLLRARALSSPSVASSLPLQVTDLLPGACY